MSNLDEKTLGYKLSRVDLEVEKLKLQADFELPGKRIDTDYLRHDYDVYSLRIGISEPLEDGGCVLKYDSQDDLKAKINENWESLTGNYVFDFLATIIELDDDELILSLYEKHLNEGNYYNDPQLLAGIAMYLKDNNLKEEVIRKIDAICMSPDYKYDGDAEDMFHEANKAGYNYTREYCQKSLRDRFISHVVATLNNPDIMMGYYNEMNDIYAKEIVLNAIQRFPEYTPQLTMEELQEVSARMKEEVVQAEALNAQTRTALEEEIMASLSQLTKAKQEYARLTQNITKGTSQEDSFDLE